MGIPTRRTIAREAVGVVGAITPWNFPHQINLAKLGPALAAGNTVVLKPAPDTPWCAAVLGELIAEHTDFPPGVINIVTSSDHGVGCAAVQRPSGGHGFVHRVDGHRPRRDGRRRRDDQEGLPRAGRQVGVPGARRRRSGRCVRDVGVHRCRMHAGQGCAITTRLVVPRASYDEAVAGAAATMAGIKPGDPTDQAPSAGR